MVEAQNGPERDGSCVVKSLRGACSSVGVNVLWPSCHVYAACAPDRLGGGVVSLHLVSLRVSLCCASVVIDCGQLTRLSAAVQYLR